MIPAARIDQDFFKTREIIINWAISTLIRTSWLVSLLLLLSVQFILQINSDPKLDDTILPNFCNFKSVHHSYNKNISIIKAQNACGTWHCPLLPSVQVSFSTSGSHSLLHLYWSYFSSVNVPGSFHPLYKLLSLPWTLCPQMTDASKHHPKWCILRKPPSPPQQSTSPSSFFLGLHTHHHLP